MTKDMFKFLFCFFLLVLGGCSGLQESEDDITDELTSDTNSTDGEAAANEDKTEEDDLEEFGAEETAPTESETSPLPPADNSQAAAPEDETPAIEEPAPEPVAPSVSENQVTAINYLSSLNGGTIEIKTASPAIYNVRPNPGANQYVIEIQNATLTEPLKRPYIMKDFEGAFGAINAYQNTGGKISRIVVQLKSAGEPIVSQEGNTLLVMAPGSGSPANLAAASAESAKESSHNTDAESYNVKEASENEKVLAARTLDEFLTGSGRFFGRPISIQTNDADVRDVIGFIAEESGVNLVIADDVDGKVSVKLRQVPWDQALVIVMRSRGLGYIRQGNVLRITKLTTLQAEATAAKDIVETQKKLTPLKVKIMPVSYASVEELAKQVKFFLTEGRGQVVSDARTSSIIITDTADVLMRVERLVKELDIPPAQVMIEGKIVEASESFTRTVGVNWSLSGSPIEVSSSGGVNGTPVRLTPGLGITPMPPSQVQSQNGFFSLRVGTMDFLGALDSTLSLAQSDSLVRIISSPRIVTMNKEKSQISQRGEVITIQSTVDVGGNRTAQANRTPVELKLEVTPQITAEGSVVLEVMVLRQFAGAQVDSETRARPINSREAHTKVLVPNGQTAVIGGIYQSDESESESGIPGLKDIPVLGWLFKQKSQERIKNELLLFLTPRILNAKEQQAAN